jgi:molybdopterin-containing oxidoreductase family iron-sulfur binding subunit
MEEKRYWSSLEQRSGDAEALAQLNQEFPAGDPFEQAAQSEVLRTSRRDFLKVLGFGIGSAATLAACTQTPVKYALPYVNKPVEIIPTIADYYASTFFDGTDYNSILVKTREGRPIKIEGNPSSKVTPQGTSASAQASVLSMYDSNRLRKPRVGKGSKDWKSIHEEIGQKLAEISSRGGRIRIVTPTVISPSTRKLIGEFADKYAGTRWVEYDPVSYSGLLDAHQKAFAQRVIPQYHFDKADLVVSFGADFLGTWLSHTEFTSDWVQKRKFRDDPSQLSRLIVFETHMSLTGANADTRIPIKPSMEGALILKLHDEIASATGGPMLGGEGMEAPGNYVAVAAQELLAKRGRSIVVSGSNDPDVQLAVASINRMLGNYGPTLDLSRPCNLRRGSDEAISELVREVESDQVDAVIIVNSNPVYSLPNGKIFGESLKKVELKVAHVVSENETSVLCDYVLPTNHYLESWGDAEPYLGSYSVQQPTIRPLFDTMQFQDCLLHYMGKHDTTYYAYLQNFWKGKLGEGSFEDAWKNFLHEGVYERGVGGEMPTFKTDALTGVGSALAARYTGNKGQTEVVLYLNSIGTGDASDNPWLQELPDPITKVTWDNYVLVPMKMAKELGLKTNDMAKVETDRHSVTLPVLVQPGQQAETIGIALGYGRTECGKAGKEVGANVYPFVMVDENGPHLFNKAKISKAEGKYGLAISQTHGTIMGRNIIRETTVSEYKPYIANYQEEREKMLHHLVSLYPPVRTPGHHWAMVIDLNACTGCGACVVACNAENNVSVVGREEVRRGREMHWIRIDRYYSDSTPENPTDPNEDPAEYPEVVFQPMLCQHCDDAPCENVCPVLATVHSSEGLNQQAYNRCFGTRYCANNCPYKVRRFNWLDYTNTERFIYNPVDDLGRMVLNPDVTVRARGVMEKCSFCQQRIQAAKLEAKKAGKPLADGAIQPACAQACAAGAIYFGDINNAESKVASLYPKHSPFEYDPPRKGYDRAYFVIEEIKTRPSIAYLVKVRNRQPLTAAVKA